MKILNLKFKNINSLYGIFEIDFTQPEFTDNGLFAITGKTGAGKSSILDAVSLALYGKTPRVGKINKDSNEVMTRGAKDCYAEIAFEVEGKKWKSSWKQQRTKTGTLSPIQRQIANYANKIYADKVSDCDNKIIGIIGLTFNQFTKVIMLAQGSFAEFLQANSKDKGELLEKITGTDIYGEISKKVFERNKTENQKLANITLEIGTIKILSEEEIEKLNKEIAAINIEKKQIDNDLQIIETAKKWLADLEILQKQIAESKQKLPELDEKLKNLNTEMKKNEKHENLLEQFEAIKNKNTQVINLLNDYHSQNEKLKKTKKDLESKNFTFNQSKTLFTEKEKLLNEKMQALETIRKELNAMLAEKQLSDYQKIKEKITQFGTNIKTLIDAEKNIFENKKEIKRNEEIIFTAKQSEKELSITVSENKTHVQNIEKHIELLAENIKLAEIVKSLDERRNALEDGAPCPLCGATEHPFAHGNEPKIGEKNKELKNLKKQFEELKNTVQQDEIKLTKSNSEREYALKNKTEKENNILKYNEIINEKLSEIRKINPNFAIPKDEYSIDFLNKLHKEKQNEYRQISETISNAENCEKQIKKLQNEEIPQLQTARQSAEKTKTDAETMQKLAEQQVKNQTETAAQAKEKYETENADLLKIFTDYNVTDIENLKKCFDAWNANKKKIEELNTKIIALKAVILEKEKEFIAKQAEKITEKTVEDLQSDYDEKKKLSDEFSQRTGANRQALMANAQNLAENNKKLKEKEQQQQICKKWASLNELIGSLDGKKYRNFAQALTFEHLIGLANHQLQKMLDRYLLKRVGDAANPFELSVIDKYQNCDERTAQNLSGGEKFIVSLSLALGLANMASRNMKIDTMFIDEGFGTLDADYLDIALSTLSNLRNEGKLIGVISHLSELKERIPTHIQVISAGNGHSKIEIQS